jgi:hypothetical protein
MGKRKADAQDSEPNHPTVEQVSGQGDQSDTQELGAVIEKALSQDRRVEVDLNSLEARVGYGSLLRELQHAFIERVAFYRSQMGGSLSIEEARANAYHACKDEEEAKRIYDKMMSYALDNLDFVDLYEMWPVAPRLAESIWEMITGTSSRAGTWRPRQCTRFTTCGRRGT